MSNTNRYSDEELALFKIHIEQKLDKASKDLTFLLGQIENISESRGNEGDRMDETSSNNDLEMLYTMANRHRHHIQDLKNALIRIHQKTYGICIITGELIDKRRLMAVSTTTKSLAAKNDIASTEVKKESRPKPTSKHNNTSPKVITKIIKKSTAPINPLNIHDDEDNDDEDDDLFDDDIFDQLELDKSEIDLE